MMEEYFQIGIPSLEVNVEIQAFTIKHNSVFLLKKMFITMKSKALGFSLVK